MLEGTAIGRSRYNKQFKIPLINEQKYQEDELIGKYYH